MEKRPRSAKIAAVAIVALLAVVPIARAGQNGTDTISIHFGANEPSTPPAGVDPGSMLAATEVTGVVPSANWNNEIQNTGLDTNLVEDNNGIATQSGGIVFWYATQTWATTNKDPKGKKENNNFQGVDRTLMTGYLDMASNNPQATFIQITLPATFSATYDVYLYTLSGVPGRGGVYAVNQFVNQDVTGHFQYLVESGTTDPSKPGNKGLYSGPDFVQAVGDDPSYGADGINQNDFGNFLLFPNQSSPTVTIIAIDQPMPSLPGYDSSLRAPINGVQIVGH